MARRLVPLCVVGLLVLAANVPCTALHGEEEGGGKAKQSADVVPSDLREELRAAARERPGAEGLLEEIGRAVPEMDAEQQRVLQEVLEEARRLPGPGGSRRQSIATLTPSPWLPPDMSTVSPIAGTAYTVILYQLHPFVDIDNYQAVPQLGERFDLALLDPGNVNGTRTAENLRLSGLTIDFLQALAQRLQITLSFVYPCPISDYYAKQGCPTPTRAAAFNMVQQTGGELFGGGAGLCLNYKCFVAGAVKADVDTLTNFAVTQPFMEKGFALVVLARPESPGFFAWSDPFTQQLWGIIVAELVFCAITFMVCEGYGTNEALWGQGNPLASFFDCLYWAVTIVLGAADKAPTTHAGRSLVQAQLFFGVLLIALYTGNLASFLSNNPQNIPVTQVTDLFDKKSAYFNKKHKICYSSDQPSILAFLKAQGADGSQFELVEATNFLDCIDMVYKGGATVTLYDEPVALAYLKDYYSNGMCGSGGQCSDPKYTDQTSCLCPPEYVLIDGDCQNLNGNTWSQIQGSLTLTGDIFNPFGYGLAFPRNVNTTDYITFSQAVVWLKDQGAVLNLENQWVPQVDQLTCATTANANVQLGFESIRGLLTTAAVIMFIGVVIALFENTIRAAIFLLPCFKGMDLEELGREAKEKARQVKKDEIKRKSELELEAKRKAAGIVELTEEQLAVAAKDPKELQLDNAIEEINSRLQSLVKLLDDINEEHKHVMDADDEKKQTDGPETNGWPRGWLRPVLRVFGLDK